PVGLLPVVLQRVRRGGPGQGGLPGGGDVTAERVDGAEAGHGDTGTGSGHTDLRVGAAGGTATPGTGASRASGGAQFGAPSMYLTASPTVARFLTSSSGMRTSNFSSALTTMVIIEMESMSRSSVKDFSS